MRVWGSVGFLMVGLLDSLLGWDDSRNCFYIAGALQLASAVFCFWFLPIAPTAIAVVSEGSQEEEEGTLSCKTYAKLVPW